MNPTRPPLPPPEPKPRPGPTLDPGARVAVAVGEACPPPGGRDFAALARMAADLAQVPCACITLADGVRPTIEASLGLPDHPTPACGPLLARLAATGVPQVVEDLRADPETSGHPLVAAEGGLRSCLAIPVHAAGRTVGALFLMDRQPRGFDTVRMDLLSALADQVAVLIELRRKTAALERAVAQRDALRSESQRFFALARDLLMVTDPRGVITRVNPAWTTHLGYPEIDLLGSTLAPLVHPEDLDRVERGMEGWKRNAEPRHQEYRIRHTDGSWRWFRGTTVRDGAEGSLFTLLHDVTDDKHLEALKSAFVSTVSHELRTPLTSIRGALGLVTSGTLGAVPDPVRELLDIANRNAQRLVLLVNDILDLDRIESGRLPMTMVPTDLRSVVRDSARANRANADAREVRLDVETTAGDATVKGDAHRLQQVVDNLLSNAVRFSPQGGRVLLRVVPRGERVRVEVRDWGPGIAPDFRGRIFGRFAQADGSDRRSAGGSGLGLNISRSLVEAHQGRIDYDSVPGQGATFWFELPAVAPQADAAGVTTEAPLPQRVLVCDDDPDVAGLVRELLESCGFDVEVAHTAADAADRIRQRDFDAMTLDLGLPDMDGLEMLRRLEAEGRTHLPVVVLSGNVPPHEESDDLGVRCWLAKPVDGRSLIRALRATLAEPRSRPARLLHVEADEELRRVTSAILGERATVIGVGTLAEARDAIIEGGLDGIVLDLGLPDGNGARLLELIDRLAPDLPVILFSAEDPDERLLGRVRATLVKTRHSEQQLVAAITRVFGAAGEPRHRGEAA
ncbi:response regulator [Myxococcota bacterium]|nr:response regulator [Myxococcota bacterium]